MKEDSAVAKPDELPGGPSYGLRTGITLILFMHLFCVFAALSSSHFPSRLQLELMAKLRIYTQLLNFEPFAPYQLTHARPFDADHRLEVLPADADENDPTAWLALPDVGVRGGERRLRYDRYAELLDLYMEQGREGEPALMASSIGEFYLHQRQVRPRQIRCRRHSPVSLEAYREPGLGLSRDPDAPEHFSVVYAAIAVVDDDTGTVSVVKQEAAGQTAGPTGNP